MSKARGRLTRVHVLAASACLGLLVVAAPAHAGLQTALVSREGLAGPGGAADSADPGSPVYGSVGRGPDVTPDGRYVVYVTKATDLGLADPADPGDVVVRDMDTGATQTVSVPDGPGDTFAIGASSQPTISDDGCRIAWTDDAATLLPGVTMSRLARVWVRDRCAGWTRLVSQRDGLSGAEANPDDVSATTGGSFEPEISGDGRRVTFVSTLQLSATSDGSGSNDVYVRDVDGPSTSATALASANPDGTPAGGGWPSISRTGEFVAYTTLATGFGDSHTFTKVVRRDMAQAPSAGATIPLTEYADGDPTTQLNKYSWYPSISADGQAAAFQSPADGAGASHFDTDGSHQMAWRWISGVGARPVQLEGTAPATDEDQAAISPDGRTVTWAYDGQVLERTDDPNAAYGANAPYYVSLTNGGQLADGESLRPALTNGAASVVFESAATNLSSDAAAQTANVFARNNAATPPVSTSPPPSVTGAYDAAGDLAVCSVGGWSGRPGAFTYAWLVGGTVVGGATGRTYTIAAGDLYKTLACRVTASNGAGAGAPATSANVTVGNPSPPVNTVRPALSAPPQVGSTLTCQPGAWTGHVDTRSYRWLRSVAAGGDYNPIDGAVQQTYTVQDADTGSRVACEETAANGGGATAAQSVSMTAATGAPQVTATPTVANKPLVGTELACADGTWTNQPLRFSHQWQRDGTDIAGAVATRYTAVAADRGHLLACVVTAANDVGAGAAASAPVHIVAGAPDNTAQPVVTLDVTGPRPTDKRATCNSGDWLDREGDFTYAWFRGTYPGAPIAGQTAATYQVTTDDLGQDVYCEVTAQNSIGTTTRRSPEALVPLPPATAGGQLETAGGTGPYDPSNFMAVDEGTLEQLRSYRSGVVQNAYQAFRAACIASGVKAEKPAGDPRREPDATKRRLELCQLILWTPESRIFVDGDGVRVLPASGTCYMGYGDGPTVDDDCGPLPIPGAGSDLAAPPASLSSQTPVRVLWDVNSDGRVDVSCPGSAPVMRTLLDRGSYNVRAVMVMPDSAESGIYPGAVAGYEHFPYDTSNQKDLVASVLGAVAHLDAPGQARSVGQVRRAQPFMCQSTLAPPADPDLPCIKEGRIGKVHVSGNICPISVRRIPADAARALPPRIQEALRNQAVGLLSGTASTARSASRGFFDDVGGYVQNVVQMQTAPPARSPSLAVAKQSATRTALGRLGLGNDAKAQFATDQIYLARGTVRINGVDVKLSGDDALVMLPSDVGEAVSTIKKTYIAADKASSSIGGLAMGADEPIDSEFDAGVDALGQDASSLLGGLRDQAVAAFKQQTDALINSALGAGDNPGKDVLYRVRDRLVALFGEQVDRLKATAVKYLEDKAKAQFADLVTQVTADFTKEIDDAVGSEVADAQRSSRDALNELDTVASNAFGKQLDALVKGGVDALVKEGQQRVVDAVTDEASAEFKKLQLDKYVKQWTDKAKAQLGPFKDLTGDGDIEFGDGFATITAKAELPFLQADDGRKIAVDVTLKVTYDGKITLEGASLYVPQAQVGAVDVENLKLRYSSALFNGAGGIDVTGQVVISEYGVDIEKFQVSNAGEIGEVLISYIAGAGGGIHVGGPYPIFLTKIGGGFKHMRDQQQRWVDELYATMGISVGPSSGGGCPIVGVTGLTTLHFGPAPLYFLSHSDFKVGCWGWGNSELYFDDTGFVDMTGEFAVKWKIIEADVKARGAVKWPDWMAQGSGDGKIDLGFWPAHPVKVKSDSIMGSLGMAVCGGVDIPLYGYVGAGVGLRFPNRKIPTSFEAVLNNLEAFTGCDLSSYEPIKGRARIAQGAAPQTVQVAPGQDSLVLRLTGSGASPRVTLTAPTGESYDLSGDEPGMHTGAVFGTRVEDEDRTFFFIKHPAAGTWTVRPAEGSAPLVTIEQAHVVPKPKVSVTVSGRGATRRLRYAIAPVPGQEVVLSEQGVHGGKFLRRIRRGGVGTVRFTVSEAQGTARSIVADVAQDGIPRAEVVVARFSAPSPVAGAPRHVRVRRSGSRAIVTWQPGRYVWEHRVSVQYADGRHLTFRPAQRTARRLVIPGVRGQAIRVTVRPSTMAGRPGRAVTVGLAARPSRTNVVPRRAGTANRAQMRQKG